MPERPQEPPTEIPFVNGMRLNARQWAAVLSILAVVAAVTPSIWKHLERFETGPDYRIPYELSKDYWLFERRLQGLAATNIVVLGDSVVWGEYVAPEGTLSHFLNHAAGTTDAFVNAGANGLFPLALEGLVRSHGRALSRRKVLLHCNVLWMTSPKADLSTDKEEQFNHAALVPQFFHSPRSYRADANERLDAVARRTVPFLSWVSHLQNAYFGQSSIPKWTLAEGSGNPPGHPNVYRNPFSNITLAVPPEPANDPQRGPRSPRHKPWSTNANGTTRFEWVAADQSIQWRAFQRLVELLRQRNNDVLVVVGPFNEHLLAPENRPAYHKLRDDIVAWLAQARIPHHVPETLPGALYADASHPLTAGYELLATRLHHDPAFVRWLNSK